MQRRLEIQQTQDYVRVLSVAERKTRFGGDTVAVRIVMRLAVLGVSRLHREFVEFLPPAERC